MSQKFIVGLCLFLMVATSVFAGTISTLTNEPGTQHDIIGITGFATTGADMGGMVVLVQFLGNPDQTCVWAQAAGVAGGCNVAGWFSISQEGDTFSQEWTFRNLSTFATVTSITLDGAPSRGSSEGVVFDRAFGNVVGTLGSEAGRDLSGSTTDASVGTGVYTDIVAISGTLPVGDVFTQLIIGFAAPLGADASATFVADTDTVGINQLIPEPGSMSLLAFGMAGVVLAARTRARR